MFKQSFNSDLIGLIKRIENSIVVIRRQRVKTFFTSANKITEKTLISLEYNYLEQNLSRIFFTDFSGQYEPIFLKFCKRYF